MSNGPSRHYRRIRPEAVLPPGVPMCFTIRVEECFGRWLWYCVTPCERRKGLCEREADAYSAARAALRDIDPNADRRPPFLRAV